MPSLRLRRTAGSAILENQQMRLAVHLAEGTFSLDPADGDGAAIARASTTVQLSDGSSCTSLGSGFAVVGSGPIEDAHGHGLVLRLHRRSAPHEPELALEIALYEEQPFAILRSALRNSTDRTLRVQAFHVLEARRLRLGAAPRHWRFYKHGWQSWSPTLVLPCAGEDMPSAPPLVGPGTQPPPAKGRFLSELVTAIVDPTAGAALTAGFISTADQFSQLWLDRGRRALTAASYADGIALAPGATLSSQRLLLDVTSNPLDALQTYGDALAREMDAIAWPHVPSGWCSWYYYWQGVSEADIVANLELLSEHRDELPLEYVQIDDGYQAGIGDWLTANEKFPHGLAWLADRIHRCGFKAGLWLAPFLAGENSRLYQEHPDWAVQYRPGRPYIAMVNWGQDCFALDCTRPEVIEWLERVFRTVAQEWDFDYVKIDFIYAAAVDGLRHDPSVTRAQAYRHGLEAVRRAVGDKFILGCGNPIGPSVGLVNGSRIGPDVAPYWRPPRTEAARSDLSIPSALNTIRNVISRFWMQGRLWLNDPDCLLLRDSETALSEEEVRSLATVIALSGGMMLASDNLTRLSSEQHRMLARLLALRGEAAVPLDLFERDLPQVLWRASDSLLAVFNWADEVADVTACLPISPARVTDFWTGESFRSAGDTLALQGMPPHSSKLLVVQPP